MYMGGTLKYTKIMLVDNRLILIDRSIPAEIEDTYREYDQNGLVNLFLGRNEVAEGFFKRQIELLFVGQKKFGRPIHKGSAFHNLALAQLGQSNKIDDSIHNSLLAYIEDTLNVEIDYEDDVDRWPAASLLRDVMKIRMRLLREIKAVSFDLKQKNWVSLVDPEPILQNALENLRILGSLSLLCEIQIVPANAMPLGFPQPLERRVFIGTNYDTFYHIIPEIKEAVILSGYTPVVVSEVAIPQERIHHHSLLLLHTCGNAIFDVTNPAGQYMEIERLKDYEIWPLLVRSAISGDTSFPIWLSRMITTLGFEVVPYADISQLKNIVRDYLRRIFPGENTLFKLNRLTQLSTNELKVQILPQSIFKRGEVLKTKALFKGKVTNGFFDNEIKLPNGNTCWNWDSMTLKDGDSRTKGILNGTIEAECEWTWEIPKYIPKGSCVIATRVYNHLDNNKRIFDVEDQNTIQII